MPKRHVNYGAQESNAKASPSPGINNFVQKLPAEKQRKLYQELKSHGEVDNPVLYTETHLEGGIESDLRGTGAKD